MRQVFSALSGVPDSTARTLRQTKTYSYFGVTMKEILINDILDEARELGGSDVHFTAGLPPVLRLHGAITKMQGYPDCTEPIIVNVINSVTTVKHKQSIAKGEDADFSYVTASGFRNRVNVYRQKGYHAIAFRLLRNDIPTLDDLFLPPMLGEFASKPRGMVLITGPTGSGKSTTLAAMIDYINRRSNRHIITIEDPIEYVHTHKQCMVNQREINNDVDSFSGALRAALREDPDVILVGEMRDFETISAAVTAAETGHLVFSTLHTVGASETLDRIIDVYPPHSQAQCRSQLANAMVGIVSQTLVPTADGKGRIVALELMNCTDAISSLIREGKTFQIPTAIATGNAKGMFTLDQHLAKLTRQKKITERDALERCKNPVEYMRFVQADSLGSMGGTPGNMNQLNNMQQKMNAMNMPSSMKR
jgi:twitching motility protein PilT